jgi:hypothetical protein
MVAASMMVGDCDEVVRAVSRFTDITHMISDMAWIFVPTFVLMKTIAN